ncbi:MAG TPA: alpha-galactosidase [Bacteroidales bacterium]|nr:alpha-galactosidase [Bacteroidales bacterium]
MFRKAILLFFAVLTASLLQAQTTAPPNQPAVVSITGNQLIISYDGQNIFTAAISHNPDEYYFREIKDDAEGAISHSFTLTATNGKPITLEGVITGSSQSFPCEENRFTGSTYIRHSFGLSHSLLNKAVYDRKRDWSLSVEQASVQIFPVEQTQDKNTFSFKASGSEICILFKPHYYQKHRGLTMFEPWNYDVWNKPVVGWSSWYAFFRDVNEKDVQQISDVLGEKLRPFGLQYIQIDDGYQQEMSYPEMWLNWNQQFPSGMKAMASYISSRGLKPGIWTNVAFENKEYAYTHKSLFVSDEKDNPAWGRWVNYVMDGSNPETLEQLIKPLYKGYSEAGWKYFKLDALRHLMYEGYNSNNAYFAARNIDRVEAFRSLVKAVRNETGNDNFLLACWGIRPELVGIVDGCRIGDDGFGLRTLTQYNSFNNVVWRNDPDHIELKEKVAFPACMVTSMTGSLFMLTDKPPVYETPLIEAAKRSIPVLFTMPGQIYDIDPSCSMYINRVGSQLSGSGPRIFDARYTSPYTHFILEINKPYENWLLLGRTDESRKSFTFAELGLDPGKEYNVFEFWAKKYLGTFKNSFEPGIPDPYYNCQMLCIREKQDHPQLIATSRHISCGGLEVSDLSWNVMHLEGNSSLVGKDEYSIYLYEPEGFSLKSFRCDRADVIANKREDSIRIITILSKTDREVNWVAEY